MEQADVYVNDHLLDKSPVGGLAVLCAQAAEEGDLAAKAIIKECAAKIFALVWDTCCKMEGKPDNRIKRELDEAFFANQEAKALQADLWLWGQGAFIEKPDMAVGKCQCKEYIFPRANHQYGKKEASECNSKNSREDCA